MATGLKELIVTYEANAKPVLDALNKIDAKIKQTSKQLKTTSDSFLKAGRDIGLSLSAPLGLLSMKALRASADFETLKMQMEVLTGSAEEGERVFNRLLQFAKTTPFELTELTKATNMLMGFGETADEAYDHIKLLGDVAAVAGGDFNGITVAFGQASAEGKLYTKDIRQLINNGVPAIKLLAEELGVAKGEVLDFAEQGKITFPVLVRALERATSKGGMFEDGMKKLSKTADGVYSNFKDNVNIALATFGDEMQKAFKISDKVEALGNWIGRLAENFSRLYPETKQTILTIVGLAVVLGPLLIMIGALIRLVSYAVLGFNFLIAPIRLLIAFLPTVVGLFRALAFVMAANPLGAFIASTVLIITYWREIVDLFKKAGAWIGKLIPSFGEVKDRQSKIDYSGTDYSPMFQAAGSAISSGVGSLNNFLSERSLLPESFLKGGANNAPMMAGGNKTVNNNLVVNIPSGTTSADASSIKAAIKAALAEENRQAYIEAGAQ